MSETFANPVIPGFHPDPSICRVGQDFYLVTSTFEYFPGIPIFHSTDLVTWNQVGHVLTRPSQLDLAGVPASGGIFAPTLRHHAGRFYVTGTNVSRRGHFVVSAENPAGPWSEPVWVDQNGIDPSLFFEDGRCYFTSSIEPDPEGPHEENPGFERGIQQCEIDPDTGAKLSPTRRLWSGSGGRFPEAPHLYRRGEYYYLLLAEGGTEYGHMVTMARSRTPWGPWEGCPRNPVLTHRSSPSPIQAVGHADLVELEDGSWWAVALGIRPVGTFHHLGRETFLVPVEWDEDGWPVFGEGGTVPEIGRRPSLPPMSPEPIEVAPDRGTFGSPVLGYEWNTLRVPLDEHAMSLTARSGALRLVGGPATTDDPTLTVLARRQQHHYVTVTADLEFEPNEGDEAGLTIRADEQHHIDIAVRRGADGARVVELRQRIGPVSGVLGASTVDDGPLALRIDATPDDYRVTVLHPGGEVALGRASTRYVSAEVARSFTGVYIGMYVSAASGTSAPAWWTRFVYDPAASEGVDGEPTQEAVSIEV